MKQTLNSLLVSAAMLAGVANAHPAHHFHVHPMSDSLVAALVVTTVVLATLAIVKLRARKTAKITQENN